MLCFRSPSFIDYLVHHCHIFRVQLLFFFFLNVPIYLIFCLDLIALVFLLTHYHFINFKTSYLGSNWLRVALGLSLIFKLYFTHFNSKDSSFPSSNFSRCHPRSFLFLPRFLHQHLFLSARHPRIYVITLPLLPLSLFFSSFLFPFRWKKKFAISKMNSSASD